MFKHILIGDEGVDALRELQERYRLPLNTDLEDLMYEIGQDFILEVKSNATDRGDVVRHGDDYYYKRKSDVTAYFENRLSEIDALDIAKYGEVLTKHFLSGDRKSIRVDGKNSSYYALTLVPFTEDETQIITEMFDDLETDI